MAGKRNAKSKGGGQDPIDWMAAYLEKNGDAPWDEVRAAAEKAGVDAAHPVNLRWARKRAGLAPKTAAKKTVRAKKNAAEAPDAPPRARGAKGHSPENRYLMNQLRLVLDAEDFETAEIILSILKKLG